MVAKKIKLLWQTKAKLVKLEQSLTSQLSKELASLPQKYGFDSQQAFFKTVRAVAGNALVSAGQNVPARPAKRRKCSIITAETKSRVKSLLAAGKTGASIAKTVGISLPSVQNIKKELELVKRRAK